MPELRPYQIEDVNFLASHPCMACFNEMRTGKTPTALKTLEKHNANKNLIICPASAIYSWQEEYIAWLNKPCEVVSGTLKQKEKAISNWKHGLIISYDSFKTTEKSQGLWEKILEKNPAAVILDEAHRIKDTGSAVCVSAHKCIKIPIRLALTGTPAPNKPYEVFAILNWLRPNTFSSYWRFIHEFFNVVNMTNQYGKVYKDIRGFKPGMETLLQQYLSEMSTQRKRKEVMPWLPDKDYQKIKLPLTPEQTKYLNELNQWFETEHIVTQGILDRLVRYRQICLHPGLLGLKGSSPKLNWIKDYINDYPDKPILIFSKFTSFIKILEQELKDKKISVIIGDTPEKRRNDLKHSFQNGEINILILNIDTGKESLTLDRAETAIFTDKYPPASDIQQAEDRFIATTEDRANKPHLIIELMMKNSYDEELYKLIEKNINETNLINDYKKYLERRTG